MQRFASWRGCGRLKTKANKYKLTFKLKTMISDTDQTPQSCQNAVIERFSILANNERLPKIIFKSDEKTAKAVRLALILDSSFYDDIQRDFHNFPTVLTTIYCKSKANIDNFLELQSVRSAFQNAL